MTVYILVCMFFPPALLAQPVFFHLWFKRVELEAREAYLIARLQYEKREAPTRQVELEVTPIGSPRSAGG